MVARNPWLAAASVQSLPVSSCGIIPSVCVCPNFLLLIGAPVIGLGPTLIHYDLTLIGSHLQRLYLQIRSHSQVSGGHEGGALFNPVQ